MRYLICGTICICTFIFGGCQKASEMNLRVTKLRCESRLKPIGIDVTAPRLSWVLESEGYGQKQTAYHIRVASDLALLEKGQGDLWDTGRIQSDQTFGIVYEGTALASEQECFWAVQVWDKEGRPSGWSEPATWSMGLLKPDDWQAQWVGLDLDAPKKQTVYEDLIAQASWIWGQPDAGKAADLGSCFFRKTFELPPGRSLKNVHCFVTADNSFELYINGYRIETGYNSKQMHSVSLQDHLRAGKNLLAVEAVNAGRKPNSAGLLLAMQMEFDDGDTVVLTADETWKTSLTESPNWQTAGFDDSDWTHASIAAAYTSEKPWGPVNWKELELPPARYFRHSFKPEQKEIAKACLYTTALGIYQVFVNGERVGDEYFSPGWTDYNKRVYYRTYDVTSLIQSGENALGAILADGWYAGYIGFKSQRNHYGKDLRLLAQLNITYADGTKAVFATGPDWKGALGPIQQADFLQGEVYDARLEMPGWNAASFDDADWQAVAVGSDEVSPKVQAAVSEPVIVFETVKPVSVSKSKGGGYVFDMGQNFAGMVRISVQGKPGQKIQLRHAERLNSDGTVFTTNLRSARSVDTYICKGDGVEVWQPYFTFHGFQYVEVLGLDAEPDLDTLVGLALSSDTPMTGTFECSDPVVNKIQQNSVWTQRMNFIDLPTDCPQRDERMGWTGDAQVYINTACYHNDVQAFFTKWFVDLADTQGENGQIPTVAPFVVARPEGGPAWADAAVICPWTIYKMYGDKRVLETHYDMMKKFIAFCKNRCTDELLPPEKFHCFGDWLNIKDDTPRDVIYMAYFGCSTKLMAQSAEALGRSEDAAAYNALFEQIKASFNRAYVEADGKIKGDTQAAYVLAIAYDLLDADKQKLAADHLVRRIHECNDHLSTGFIGTKDLMLVLAKIGRNDLAYKLLHNDTFPSWGFSVKHGATSIWERWNGWTPERGFGNSGMNSFAHYSFGAVCQWMFENIGGIQTDGPAFKQIVLKPCPGGKLTWARTQYDSIRGTIGTDWKLDGNVFDCSVVIPPNTTAMLYVPAASKDSVQIEPYATVDSFADGTAVLQLPSGRYQVRSEMP